MLVNRISRCISATKSISRHAFVEFIKNCSGFIETWLFNGSDRGVPVPSFDALSAIFFYPSKKTSPKKKRI